jgi:hypothetical protein
LAAFTLMAVVSNPTRRAGILPNPVGDNVDLIQQIALAALQAKPADEMEAFVDTVLTDRPFTTWKFTTSVQAILAGKGVDPTMSAFGRRRSNGIPLFGAAHDDAWNRSANKAMRALAASVTGGVAADAAKHKQSGRYLQFSALVRLTGLWESDAADVFAWDKDFDEEAVAEAIRGLVAASAIDGVQLAVEAREACDRLDAEPLNHLHKDLGNPDVPDPAWNTVAALPLDRAKVEIAFHHGSSWLLMIAANLLAVLPSTGEDCERLLGESEGVELFYASQVAAHHLSEVEWRDLVLDRLDAEIPEGAHHLLAALATATVDLTASTEDVVSRAIRADDPQIVEAGAKLAVRWISTGEAVDIDSVLAAFQKSLHGDRAAVGSRIHTEVRAELLKLIIDPDSKVRAVAEDESLRRQSAPNR